MHAARRLLAQRHLAVLLCVATLVLKLLVPTGYMIGGGQGGWGMELCSGMAAQPMTMAMPSRPGDGTGHREAPGHGKAELPCAFSGLSAVALGAVDPIQLAACIAFVMAVGLLPAVSPAVVRRAHVRPPLRGPPPRL